MAERYAGIDWASVKHDVLVADESGTEVLAATYAHNESGLSALCGVLVRLEVVLVAIERPDGLLVERLLDAGLQVLALHPNKVAAARDRLPGLAREVGFDAFVLCEFVRTDHHRFRVLEPDLDQTKAARTPHTCTASSESASAATRSSPQRSSNVLPLSAQRRDAHLRLSRDRSLLTRTHLPLARIETFGKTLASDVLGTPVTDGADC